MMSNQMSSGQNDENWRINKIVVKIIIKKPNQPKQNLI